MPNYFVNIRQELFLCIRLALRARTIHFEGQTSLEARIPPFRRFACAIGNHFLGYPDSDVNNANFFVDMRQDLGYAADWPSGPVRPILKVKRAQKRAYPPFR